MTSNVLARRANCVLAMFAACCLAHSASAFESREESPITVERGGALLDLCGHENLLLSPRGRFLAATSGTGRSEYRGRIGDVQNISHNTDLVVLLDLDCISLETECVRRIEIPDRSGARQVLFSVNDDLIVVGVDGTIRFRDATSATWRNATVPHESTADYSLLSGVFMGPSPSRSVEQERERIVRAKMALLTKVRSVVGARRDLYVRMVTARGAGQLDVFFQRVDRPELYLLGPGGELEAAGLRPGSLWQPIVANWHGVPLAIDRHVGKAGPVVLGSGGRADSDLSELLAQSGADPPIFPVEDGSTGAIIGFHGEQPGSFVSIAGGRAAAAIRALAAVRMPTGTLVRGAGVSSVGRRQWLATQDPRGYTKIDVAERGTATRIVRSVECPLRNPESVPLSPFATEFALVENAETGWSIPARLYRSAARESSAGLLVFLPGGTQLSNRFGVYTPLLSGAIQWGFDVLDVSYSGSTGHSAALADRLSLEGADALKADIQALSHFVSRYRQDHPGAPVLLMAQSFAGVFYWALGDLDDPSPMFDRILLVGPFLRYREGSSSRREAEARSGGSNGGADRLYGNPAWTKGEPIREYLLRPHRCPAIATRIASGEDDPTFEPNDIAHCGAASRPQINMVPGARHDASLIRSRDYRDDLVWLLFGPNARPRESSRPAGAERQTVGGILSSVTGAEEESTPVGAGSR